MGFRWGSLPRHERMRRLEQFILRDGIAMFAKQGWVQEREIGGEPYFALTYREDRFQKQVGIGRSREDAEKVRGWLAEAKLPWRIWRVARSIRESIGRPRGQSAGRTE